MSDGKLIGWCDVTSLYGPIFTHVGSFGMAVLAPYRGRGVGRALMSTILQKARMKGLTHIKLTVRENNATAIALYKKFGLVIEGIQKNGVCIEGQYENHIFMALLFDT